MQSQLAVIVVNYCTAELTIRAVDALLLALSTIEGSKVIVVDNASPDASYHALSEHRARSWGAQVDVVLTPKNGGYGYGINQGVLHARKLPKPPELIYALNSDAFVGAETLQTLLRFMDAHPEAGVIGGAVVGTDGSFQAAGFRFPSLLGELELTAQFGPLTRLLKDWSVPMGELEETMEVDWVPGSSMLIRSQVFEDAGLFDERFFLYFEETDFCKRVWASGWKVFIVEDAAISHVGAASTGLYKPLQRTPRYWFESRHRYLLKHHGWAYTVGTDCAWLAGETIQRVKRLILRRGAPRAPRAMLDFLESGVRDLLNPLRLFDDPERPSAARGEADPRRPEQVGPIELLAEDLSVYSKGPGRAELLAVLAHRLAWRMSHTGDERTRKLRRAAAQGLLSAVSLSSGIRLSLELQLGRRVRLGPGGCMMLDARSIGDDTYIQHGACLGPLRAKDTEPQARPVVERGARVASGSCVLGSVTIGSGAQVRPNSVVFSDVPPNATVLGVPAKVV